MIYARDECGRTFECSGDNLENFSACNVNYKEGRCICDICYLKINYVNNHREIVVQLLSTMKKCKGLISELNNKQITSMLVAEIL